MLNVQFGTIKSYLQSFKDIFKRSAFEKYIIKSEEELVIQPTLKYGLKLATKHLIDNRVVKQPIKKIEKFGILYYLANVYNINEYTLEFLAENSNLEPLEITKMYTNILKFYKLNPSLKEELDIQ